MKKILIVNNNLHIGGVQKALCALLDEISGDYEITLLLFYDGGVQAGKLPENVRVLTPCKALRRWGMTRDDCNSRRSLLARGFWAALTRLFGRGFSFSCAGLFQKKLRGYDMAISFLHSGPARSFYGGCAEFVQRCVEAERKTIFLHCDFAAIGADDRYNAALYSRFDAVAACSEGCRDSFLQCMPGLSDRTVVVRNCLSYPAIARMAASAGEIRKDSGLRLVTVARFGREKAIPRAVSAIAALGERASEVRLDVIGDGAEMERTKQLVRELGLETTVFLHGQRENPYGHIRAADVLLIPSVSEAAPLVISEAASLGTPVLSTRTVSAMELVEKPGIGWVCDNSVEGIRGGIEALLDDPDEIHRVRAHLAELEFSNAEAVRQFTELVS